MLSLQFNGHSYHVDFSVVWPLILVGKLWLWMNRYRGTMVFATTPFWRDFTNKAIRKGNQQLVSGAVHAMMVISVLIVETIISQNLSACNPRRYGTRIRFSNEAGHSWALKQVVHLATTFANPGELVVSRTAVIFAGAEWIAMFSNRLDHGDDWGQLSLILEDHIRRYDSRIRNGCIQHVSSATRLVAWSMHVPDAKSCLQIEKRKTLTFKGNTNFVNPAVGIPKGPSGWRIHEAFLPTFWGAVAPVPGAAVARCIGQDGQQNNQSNNNPHSIVDYRLIHSHRLRSPFYILQMAIPDLKILTYL